MRPLALLLSFLPLAALPAAVVATPTPAPRAAAAPPAGRTFAEVSVRQLRRDPARWTGTTFEERFVFSRIWWGREREKPGRPALELPTHFTARIAAAPAYVARIEFPPEADSLFENMRDGTTVRLRVRFLRLHPASQTPVFAFEKLLPPKDPTSPLDLLRR